MRPFLHVAASLLAANAAVAAFTTGSAHAAAFTFVTFDVPGATDTFATGINNLGQIAGFYDNGVPLNEPGAGSGVFVDHGFTGTVGSFATIDGPSGALSTILSGINDGGQLTGSYTTSLNNTYATNISHGFVDTGGSLSPVVPPGAVYTVPRGINNQGQVSGFFSSTLTSTGPGTPSGFVDTAGNFVTVDPSGTSGVLLFGINNSSEAVGVYLTPNPSVSIPFTDTAGTITNFLVPGLIANTLSGINDNGQIVGTAFTNPSELGYGFVEAGGSFVKILVPNALETSATGINDEGQVVGYYYDGHYHGFVATPVATAVPEPASVTLLGFGLAAVVSLSVKSRRSTL